MMTALKPNAKKPKQRSRARNPSKRVLIAARTNAAVTTAPKNFNCNEVFDGSWPDSETINFLKNGLIEAGR